MHFVTAKLFRDDVSKTRLVCSWRVCVHWVTSHWHDRRTLSWWLLCAAYKWLCLLTSSLLVSSLYCLFLRPDVANIDSVVCYVK